MKINFYNCLDDYNKLNKTLSNKTELDIVLKERNNFINPSIILKNQIPNFSYNYCFIPGFNRYYFIENIEILSNNLILLSLKIDVLMTYKNDINNSFVTIAESSEILNENKLNYDSEDIENITKIDLNNPFTGNSDILITVNGNVQ